MKGRTGLTRVETTHELSPQLSAGKEGKSPGGTKPFFQSLFRPARLSIAIGGLALLFLLAVFVAGYASKLYQNWREKSLTDRATALVQEQRFSEAAQIARELLNRHPHSLPALVILAETAEKQNLEEAVQWRQQIARLLPKDAESQLNFASAALRFGNFSLAREALGRVSASDRDTAAFHVVAGWLASAEGNFAEQEEQFAAALEKEPNNELYQFNLAALQIRSKDTQKRNNARDTLERLSKMAPYRTGALRALLNEAVENNDLPAAGNLAQQLQMSPEVTFGDYLLCLNLYRKLDEKKFRLLLERVKPFAARTPSDLATLMEWMNQNGLAGEVVKWLDKLPHAELSSPPASVAVSEAYATVKNWSRLKHWTQTGNWGDAEYLRLAYQAMAIRHLRSGSDSGANSDFQTLWQSANELSREAPERELTLARLATKSQLDGAAEELWLGIEKNPQMRREALDNLRRLYRAKNETTRLYGVLQRLHDSSPNEAPITADLARLGLNLGQDTERSHQLAKEAYDRAPKDPNCAVTYAFSLNRLGRNTEAVAVIQTLSADALRDPHAAVYVALIRTEAGQPDAAKEELAAAENARLYPEEKKVLEEAKTSLVTASATPSPTDPEILLH